MPTPQLTVIQGGWVRAPKLLQLPQTIAARSPFDKNQICAFRVCRDDVRKSLENRRRQPVYDLHSVLLGQPPKIPQVVQRNPQAYVGLSRLTDAHACFAGLRRAHDEDNFGTSFIAYVLKPHYFYEYVPDPICYAKKADVPEDLVFVAYARLDEPCASDGHLVKGVLTHWQFVQADGESPLLPIDHDTRYNQRLW